MNENQKQTSGEIAFIHFIQLFVSKLPTLKTKTKPFLSFCLRSCVRLSIFPLPSSPQKGSVSVRFFNMAPVTRRTSFPKVLIERDSDSEQSSSSDEEEALEEEEQEEENGVVENEKIEKLEVGFDANRKGKTPITLTLRKVCKVG